MGGFTVTVGEAKVNFDLVDDEVDVSIDDEHYGWISIVEVRFMVECLSEILKSMEDSCEE